MFEISLEVDRDDMHADIVSWPDQVRDGWTQGRAAAREFPRETSPDGVLWCGMGGSAIGGDFLAALASPRAPYPLQVHRGGPLPAWTNERTLVILASYSGATAETLAIAREAMDRGCRLAALTSGGTLAKLADRERIERWPVRPGRMPRAALGEMFATALGAFHQHEWLSTDTAAFEECLRVLEQLTAPYAQLPGDDHPLSDSLASLLDRRPMVYASGILRPVARRWANQFNENAKRAAQWGELPEMNHNEVVAYRERGSAGERYAVFLLDDPFAPDDVRARIPVTLELARRAGFAAHRVQPDGEHDLTRLLAAAVRGDWLSYWLALAHGIDPSPIPAIDTLKLELKRREKSGG